MISLHLFPELPHVLIQHDTRKKNGFEDFRNQARTIIRHDRFI